MKKILFSILFIVIATLGLLIVYYCGWERQYMIFSLIPLLISYYLGQLSVRKSKKEE